MSFTPGYAGGVAISDYEYELDNSGTWTSTASTTSPLTISGLANATTYVVAIRAVTASGNGAAIRRRQRDNTRDAWSTERRHDNGRRQDVVDPLHHGRHRRFDDYELRIPARHGRHVGYGVAIREPDCGDGTHQRHDLSGQRAGDQRRRARRGDSAADGHAATVPGPPVIVGDTVAGSNHQLSAAFTAPSSDGGSTIIGLRLLDRRRRDLALGRHHDQPDRDLGAVRRRHDPTRQRRHVLRRVACHQRGSASGRRLQSPPVSRRRFRRRPASASVTPGPSSLAVVITPPSNGGAAITSYQYQLGTSGWVNTGTLGTSFLISGLTNGTSYGVSVRANNAQGPSSASGSTAGTPRTTPAQPTITGVSSRRQVADRCCGRRK